MALPRDQRGYSLSEENTPFETPRERRGESPSTPGIGSRVYEGLLGLRSVSACCFLHLNDLICSYPRCRSACVSAVFSNFRLLWMLSALRVPTRAALLRSPRLFAPSVEGGRTALAAAGTTENTCTVDRRKLGCTSARSAERQRIIGAEANRIAKPMAASEAMPPRRDSHSPGAALLRAASRQWSPFLLGGVRGAVVFPGTENSPPYFASPHGVGENYVSTPAR